jgi:hypothetical protein
VFKKPRIAAKHQTGSACLLRMVVRNPSEGIKCE